MPRGGMFDPISLPSGLDTRDYLRMSQQDLAATQSRQGAVSSAMQDRLEQEKLFRTLEAARLEQSALQELDKLDTLDPDFVESAEMFTELGTHAPAVGRALGAKYAKYNQNSTVLSKVSDDLAKLRAGDDKIDSTLQLTRGLLRAGGSAGQQLMSFRTRLSRDAGEKELEEKLSFNRSQMDTSETRRDAKAFTKGLSDLQTSVASRLKDISGLPEGWLTGNLIDMAYPEDKAEQTIITRDNMDDYILEGKEQKRVLGGASIEGTFQRARPDAKASVLASFGAPEGVDKVAWEDVTTAALAHSSMDEDIFVAQPDFTEFIMPSKAKGDPVEYFNAGGKGLSPEGTRYKEGREAILKGIHQKLRAVDEVPLDIRKFFDSTRMGINYRRVQQAKARNEADAVETVSDLETDKEGINSYVQTHIEKGK